MSNEIIPIIFKVENKENLYVLDRGDKSYKVLDLEKMDARFISGNYSEMDAIFLIPPSALPEPIYKILCSM